MNFICSKRGCKTSNGIPKEFEELFNQWDMEIEERTKQRKLAGCLMPDRAICDCPVCGSCGDQERVKKINVK